MSNYTSFTPSNAEITVSDTITLFLQDRKASGCTKRTLENYGLDLNNLSKFCNVQGITFVTQISSNILRQYLLQLGKCHNPGGVHKYYRSVRAMFNWVDNDDLMLDGWKNPIKKVRAPKVPNVTVVQSVQES